MNRKDDDEMRGTPKKEDFLKIPNLLCYLRILMVPLFIYLFYNDYHIQSALVVIAAAVTDILDGYIARHYNLITDWGKFIDPVADKMMQLSMLIVTIFKVKWILILAILFAIKEILLLIIGIYIYHNDYNLKGANWAGKLCTVVLDTVMVIFIAFPTPPDAVAIALVGIVTIFLFISFISYMREYMKIYREHIKAVK